MTLSIYDSKVEKKIRDLAEKRGATYNAILNELLEGALSIPSRFSDDPGENVQKAGATLQLFAWEELEGIQAQLQAQPLTRGVSLEDVVACAVHEGGQVMTRKIESGADIL